MIRPFLETDGPGLFAYLSDERAVHHEPYGVFTEEGAYREAARRAADPAFGAVCLKTTEELIGNVYLSEQDFDTWEIGYVFNPHFWGKGYATEAMQAVVRYAFIEGRARRVVAHCNPENPASWRLLERLHLRREGHLRQNIWFKKDAQGQPVWLDTYDYGLLRDEWEKLM